MKKDNDIKEIDLEKVKDCAKNLFDLVELEVDEKYPIFCIHPYTNSTHIGGKNHSILDLTKAEDFASWRTIIFERIDAIKDVWEIFCIIEKAWYLTFLSMLKEYLPLKTFSALFGYSWVAQENPNGDVNVPLEESIDWFRQADKQSLMSTEDYKKYVTFESGITVYRGVAVGRKPNGLSWTLDLDKAIWFAHRFDTDLAEGYVQKLVVKDKKNILAYFTIRNEDEVVIDTFKEVAFKIL